MNSSLFLDTTIFFQCIKRDQNKTILDHAVHLGFEIHTSITVLGEALAQMRESDDRDIYIARFNELLDSWNVYTHYPNDPVRILCYVLGDDETDTRMVREPTDRTHMAYAMAYKMNYFLTTDRNLIRYRIPKKIEDIGFVKPFTVTLDEFKDRELSK